MASAASLAAYSIAGGPLGAINDIGNATVGLLSGLVVWRLRVRGVAGSSGAGSAATVAGLAGGIITAIGSGLVLSRTSGWFFAGLVSSVGAALIGLWLIAVSRSLRSSTKAGPRRKSALVGRADRRRAIRGSGGRPFRLPPADA